MSALDDIAAERRRQLTVEGRPHPFDDQYMHGDLALAASAYAYSAGITNFRVLNTAPQWWPWSAEWWKPTTPRRDLVKAGALIVADIERIDRAEAVANGRPANPAAGWQWWAGENDEWYVVGPCASRDEAIERALQIGLGNSYDPARPGYTIYLIEARQDPLTLADWIDVEGMVKAMHERLGDDLGGEDGDSPADGAWTDAQFADLDNAVQAAVAAWQTRHGIIVKPRQFTDSRNAERLSTIALAPDPAAGESPAAPDAPIAAE